MKTKDKKAGPPSMRLDCACGSAHFEAAFAGQKDGARQVQACLAWELVVRALLRRTGAAPLPWNLELLSLTC